MIEYYALDFVLTATEGCVLRYVHGQERPWRRLRLDSDEEELLSEMYNRPYYWTQVCEQTARRLVPNHFPSRERVGGLDEWSNSNPITTMTTHLFNESPVLPFGEPGYFNRAGGLNE